jgi:hypothetical protein
LGKFFFISCNLPIPNFWIIAAYYLSYISRLALKFIVMTRQGAGGREQGEKGFEPCLLFFTQFGFIVPTYLPIF